MILLGQLLTEHRSACEFDLLRQGRALREFGPAGVPWHDAYLLLSHQHRVGSALFRAQNPERWEWDESLSNSLLGMIFDRLNMDAWGQSDPKKRPARPPESVRPWVADENRKVDKVGESEGVSRAEMMKRVLARNGRA